MNHSFGSLIPFSEPSWYGSQSKSPYYSEDHERFREKCREFTVTHIIPFVDEWEDKKRVDPLAIRKCAEYGLLSIVTGIFSEKEKIKVNHFHELIFIDELMRCCSVGVVWGLIEGLQIGLPPVANFGNKRLQEEVTKLCLTGHRFICLCITEPHAGSDVAAIRTTARKTSCGLYYIVDGSKKWITNGTWADFFTVAVRTGGPGIDGISVILIPRQEGVETRPLSCMGAHASGTAFVTFTKVKVPVENLIGEEGNGFNVIMNNFNHERWGFVVQATRLSRMAYQRAFEHATKRSTFGKKLIENQIIRFKLSEMARQIEGMHSWLETLTHQMNFARGNIDGSLMKELAGPIALAKANSTKILEYCAREAMQILGGSGYTKTGVGKDVERIYRDTKALAIPGGSEEILLDFSARQSIKFVSRM